MTYEEWADCPIGPAPTLGGPAPEPGSFWYETKVVSEREAEYVRTLNRLMADADRRTPSFYEFIMRQVQEDQQFSPEYVELRNKIARGLEPEPDEAEHFI